MADKVSVLLCQKMPKIKKSRTKYIQYIHESFSQALEEYGKCGKFR